MRRFLLLTVAALLVLPGCVKPREWKAALARARAAGVIDVDARLHGDPRYCSDVVSRMRAKSMVRCSPDADVTVRAELDVQPPDHRWESRHHATDYVVAVYEVPNPEFEATLHRLRSARRALARAEEQLAELEPGCEQIGEAEALVHRRRDGLADAERAVEGTPRSTTEEEFATYAWTSVHHAWTSEYDWSATLSGAGASLSRSGAGDVRFEGVDQPGFPPAGVQERHAYEPDQDRVAGEAYERSAIGVARMLDEQLGRAAALRERQCAPTPRLTDDPDWLECRAEVRLLRGEAPWRR